MPRQYQRKTDRGLVPKEAMSDAVNRVLEGAAFREVADEMGLSRSTLHRYVQKARANPEAVSFEPNFRHAQVFSDEMENMVGSYFENCSKLFHGITPKRGRKLAFQLAKKNAIDMPATWHANRMAGKDWFNGFMKRHPRLSIRSPEATSIARSSAFCQKNVDVFFNQLEELLEAHQFTGQQIYNLDESGFTTVQKTGKVVARKGVKQVGQTVSRERGELVTVCAIVSATGNSVPPAFIFPRKNFKELFMHGAPEGSLGLVNSSGWMTSELFPLVIAHILRHTRCSKDYPILVIMDNHESHLTLDALQMAKENGLHILTLPPHTSNHLQPLDRSVFGPVKSYFNAAANGWMLSNPGKHISIYTIAELVAGALTKGATPKNIMAGFKATGIWPFNRHIFTEEDFLPSTVTNRCPQPQPGSSGQEPVEGDDIDFQVVRLDRTRPVITPEELRPYPKAQAKTPSKRGRKPGRSMVATATPEMEAIKDKQIKKTSKPPAKKKLFPPPSAKSVREPPVDPEKETPCTVEEPPAGPVSVEPSVGSFVVVRFAGKRSVKHFVAEVLEIEAGELKVDFYRKKGQKFDRPAEPDISYIDVDQIVRVLPSPLTTGRTERDITGVAFDVDWLGFTNIS